MQRRTWSSSVRRGVSSSLNYITPPRISVSVSYAHSRTVRMVHTSSQEGECLNTALKSKTEPVDAAKAFTKQIRAALAGKLKDTSLEDSLDAAWNGLIEVAANLPHESQKPLVDILCAVQKENLSDKYPKESVIWGENVKVFEGLPLFGPAVRSAWNKSTPQESHILHAPAS